MQQENKQSHSIGITNKATVTQQVEWLEGVIEQLEEFKNKVRKENVILDGGYFGKTLNLPEIDVARMNDLTLSLDYIEIK